MLKTASILCIMVCFCVANYISETKLRHYCSKAYQCSDENQNSICEFKCELASECRKYIGFELSNSERQYVLDVHNFYRGIVAAGYEKRGGHSSAANMMVLNYEKQHEDVIQCWLRRCAFAVDKCRSIKNSTQNGQNIYQLMELDNWNSRFEDAFVLINRSIATWYSEVVNTNKVMIDKWPEHPPPNTANVSQILWAETVGVGCGFARMLLGDIPNLMTWRLYCNYNPGTVYKAGGKMYVRGKPATKCPGSSKRNSEYTDLCGELHLLYKNRTTVVAYIDDGYYEHKVKRGRQDAFVRDRLGRGGHQLEPRSTAAPCTMTMLYLLGKVVFIVRLIIYIYNK